MIPQTSIEPGHPDPTGAPASRPRIPGAGAPDPAAPIRLRLDRIDRRILAELQQDATLPLARLADRVGLSQTPCWKRVRKLEEAGVIIRRVALVDPSTAGLDLTAFVAVTAADHSPVWQEAFARAVAGFPEVLEIWRMAGEADYLLKVVTRDLAAFDGFYRRLTERIALKAVTSQFAMERVAYSTALPIPSQDP